MQALRIRSIIRTAFDVITEAKYLREAKNHDDLLKRVDDISTGRFRRR